MSHLATGAVGVGLLAGAWYGLRWKGVQRADVRLGDALRRVSSPAADRAVVATTDLGSLYAVAGTSAALALAGHRRAAADVAAIGGLAWTVAQRSKTGVSRARPYEADGVRRLIRGPAGSSFPSGHATVSAATTALLAERVRSRPVAWCLRGVGVYVAASRVYLGVHYPTDVVGGAGLGLVLAGLWRGPVAAAGRSTVEAGVKVTRRLGPPLVRTAASVVLGVRLRPRRRRRQAPAKEVA